MSNLNIVMELTKRVKRLGQEKERAKGHVEQQLKGLKEDFNCSSLKQAERLLKKEKPELKELDAEFKASLDSFTKKWEDELGEDK